ncbi:MAG: PQQ-like beta-propeller repeat protein [Pirellulales bacterium]|nr:PQQ-like beta-propeller repeat protein [Pirellulales bacterium]
MKTCMEFDSNNRMLTHCFNTASGKPTGLQPNHVFSFKIRWPKVPEVNLSVWVLFAVTLVFTAISSVTEATASDNSKENPAAHDTDWPRFRGPNGTGISHADTVPLTWTAKDYNWILDLPGHGHGSPVVVGDRLYLISGEPDTAERSVVCVHVNRGDILWKRNFSSKPHRLHHANSYGSTTPAADANGVVVTWSDPEKILLMALDRKGKTVWQKNLGPYQAINGAGTSPIIVDDLVVLMNVQMDPEFMISIGVLPQNYPNRTAHDSFLLAVIARAVRFVGR